MESFTPHNKSSTDSSLIYPLKVTLDSSLISQKCGYSLQTRPENSSNPEHSFDAVLHVNPTFWSLSGSTSHSPKLRLPFPDVSSTRRLGTIIKRLISNGFAQSSCWSTKTSRWNTTKLEHSSMLTTVGSLGVDSLLMGSRYTISFHALLTWAISHRRGGYINKWRRISSKPRTIASSLHYSSPNSSLMNVFEVIQLKLR